MAQRRGLIVNSFKYCGLFPLENTVAAHEYTRANIFKDPFENHPVQQKNPPTNSESLLRRIIKSSNKVGNPFHK